MKALSRGSETGLSWQLEERKMCSGKLEFLSMRDQVMISHGVYAAHQHAIDQESGIDPT